MKIIAILTAALALDACTLTMNADGSKSATVDGVQVAKAARAIIVASSSK